MQSLTDAEKSVLRQIRNSGHTVDHLERALRTAKATHKRLLETRSEILDRIGGVGALTSQQAYDLDLMDEWINARR